MATYQEQALAYLRGEMNAEERGNFEEALVHSAELRAELESSRVLLDMLDAASNESIIRSVNTQMQQAIRERASDIHILPGVGRTDQGTPQASQVLYRIDGQLREISTFPAEQHRAVIDRWKVMAEMNVAEQRVPQDGRIFCRYQQNNYELRVSVLPTVAGERITARILDRERVLRGLDELGMDASTLAIVKRLVERPHGFVLLTGPTNSGKTTFAYALLRHIQAHSAQRPNILTVENPVEYQMSGMSQIGVWQRAGMTYATALRSIGRSDPDVVYVAEMRDLETAELSLELAVTGHLVISHLHTSSAIEVLQRLRDIGLVNHLLASNLTGMVGLRLVRRVCPDCAQEYEPAARDLAKAGLSLAEDGPFRRGVGCNNCRHTGYRGRIGLFEALELDERIRGLIADKTDLNTLWLETFGRRGGSLWDDAREKIRQGQVTVEDVVWALFDYSHPRNGVGAVLSSRGVIDLTEL